jgi:hypothetical protein
MAALNCCEADLKSPEQRPQKMLFVLRYEKKNWNKPVDSSSRPKATRMQASRTGDDM